MTITRSGANQAYSDNWAKAFGGKRNKAAESTKTDPKTGGKKKAGKAKKGKK